jgi:hypothetical protein
VILPDPDGEVDEGDDHGDGTGTVAEVAEDIRGFDRIHEVLPKGSKRWIVRRKTLFQGR